MIPFTQYIRPHGRQVPTGFTGASAEVEVMAHALIGRGYSFGVEDLGRGLLAITCTGADHSGEEADIAIEVVLKEKVLPGIEKLITSAHTYVFGSKS